MHARRSAWPRDPNEYMFSTAIGCAKGLVFDRSWLNPTVVTNLKVDQSVQAGGG